MISSSSRNYAPVALFQEKERRKKQRLHDFSFYSRIIDSLRDANKPKPFSALPRRTIEQASFTLHMG
jgi:hypothetical protein